MLPTTLVATTPRVFRATGRLPPLITRSLGRRATYAAVSLAPPDELYLSAKVDVIAHRGASGHMPDHTLPTYRYAFESGADWIELDAHSTVDGTLVVHHDVELRETTDVADWDWARPYRRRCRAP